MIRALTVATLFIALSTLLVGNAFALGYKEAKAECLKEKPELKGKILRTCIKEKEAAAKADADPSTGAKAATEATDTESIAH